MVGHSCAQLSSEGGGPIYFKVGLIDYRLQWVVMRPGVPVTTLYVIVRNIGIKSQHIR